MDTECRSTEVYFSCLEFWFLFRLVPCSSSVMFVVKTLQPFPTGAQPFADNDHINDVMESRGLTVNTSMCAGCPPMSAAMELPHYFAHVYAGLEMLQRGQEEVQMCGILKSFVHENLSELKSDTEEYFSHPGQGATSVVRYVNSMMKKFVPATAALVYLMARGCNAHTCVYFANCVWSTVDDNCAYYITVELAAVGQRFVLLESLEQEKFKVVVGEIKVLHDPDDALPGDEFEGEELVSVSSDDSDYCELMHPQSPVQVSTKECAVQVKCLPMRRCFPQVYAKLSIQVECLSWSLLTPGRVFKSERVPKSVLHPGHVFRGAYDWRKCTMLCDRPSVSAKMPGKVFSSKGGPRDRLSVSSRKPGYVFSDRARPTPNWTQCTVPIKKPSHTCAQPETFVHQVGDDIPREFNATLCCKCVQVRCECASPTVTMFSCRICKVAKKVELTHAAIKRHVE